MLCNLIIHIRPEQEHRSALVDLEAGVFPIYLPA